MNLDELKKDLLKSGLRPNAVSFPSDGMTAAEQFCVVHERDYWEIYYFERGNKNQLKRFYDEQSACNHLIEMLKSDKTVWQN